MMDNKTKYNLDHVYCHTNDSNNYIRANHTGTTTTSTDMMSLIKENKKLKAMLILHLDLIQEQSDQLLAKDKLLAGLKEENHTLKGKIERLDRELQDSKVTVTSMKITKNEPASPLIEIKEEVVDPAENYDIQLEKTENATEDLDENMEPIISECNGKIINKFTLPKRSTPGKSPSSIISEMSEGEDSGTVIGITEDSQLSMVTDEDRGLNNSASASPQVKDHIKDLPSPLSLMSAPCLKLPDVKIDSDESFSCDSTIDRDQEQIRHAKIARRSSRRSGVLTTNKMYPTREWQDEHFCEEFIKEEAKALNSDVPMLEIPKWTVHEVLPLYVIEGTEDLTDDTFLKRHAKLEHDEKRRKKWDVQQIREQRRIERLKRRHCKDELREEDVVMNSYYPPMESIQTISYTSELPVVAFGESVPRLSHIGFSLPWCTSTTPPAVPSKDNLCQQQSSNTLFFFIKKRRRQQSTTSSQVRKRVSAGGGTPRLPAYFDNGKN